MKIQSQKKQIICDNKEVPKKIKIKKAMVVLYSSSRSFLINNNNSIKIIIII